VITGYGSVVRTAAIERGSTVAVIGCGGVGLSAINAAAMAGAGRIIAVDVHDGKLELAKRFGATDVVDGTTTDAVEVVKDMTSGGVAYSFEALGRKQTAEQAFRMLRVGGVATIIGMLPDGETIEVSADNLLYNRKLQGSTMGSNQFRVDMPRLVDSYLEGKLKLDELTARRLPLKQINEVFDGMKSGEPFTIYRTPGEDNLLQLLRLRAARQYGFRFLDQRADLTAPIGGGPKDPVRRTAKMLRLMPVESVDTTQDADDLLRQIARIKPDVLTGYPGVLAHAAQRLPDHSDLRVAPGSLSWAGNR